MALGMAVVVAAVVLGTPLGVVVLPPCVGVGAAPVAVVGAGAGLR